MEYRYSPSSDILLLICIIFINPFHTYLAPCHSVRVSSLHVYLFSDFPFLITLQQVIFGCFYASRGSLCTCHCLSTVYLLMVQHLVLSLCHLSHPLSLSPPPFIPSAVIPPQPFLITSTISHSHYHITNTLIYHFPATLPRFLPPFLCFPFPVSLPNLTP